MKASRDLNLQDKAAILGHPCCSVFTSRDQNDQPSQPFRTIFIQETLKRGLLMPSSIVSYSHTDGDINETFEKVHDAWLIYKKALNEGVEKYPKGRSIQPVWRKYNEESANRPLH